MQSNNSTLVLTAPLSGWLVPIEAVPDPVFAQKMVGDGISVDPVSGCLVAPCDGTVVQLHSAGHAITLATDQGAEVLMHIGLDTVTLKGSGFTPRVQTGEKVKRGEPLIDFDADYVATHARSLLTQIVITNMQVVASLSPKSGTVVAGKDLILEISLSDHAAQVAETSGLTFTSDAILIPNPSGLHARPAATLANAAKKFTAEVRLQRGDQYANAKSVVAIMGLEIQNGDRIVVVARGADAQDAVRVLAPMIESGLNEEIAVGKAATAAATAPAVATVPEPAGPVGETPGVLAGVAASPGLAVGNAFRLRREEIKVVENAADPREEHRQLEAAVAKAKSQLEDLQTRLKETADDSKAEIFGAHEELLDDPELRAIAESAIAKGKSAGFAWKMAVETHASRLASLRNELLAGRANDLRDVGRRVLECLTGAEGSEMPPVPSNTILVAEDLTPSDTANLDRARVIGFCTTLGGATSHVSILARSMDIPAVAGIDPRALDVADGTPVILDGSKGTLRIDPDPEEVARVRARQERRATRGKAELERASEPAITQDGVRIEVVANIGGLEDAELMVRLGGEGVGLLRSEFLFMDRSEAPSEDEQYEVYSSIAKVVGNERPLIIRTLDVGGDKPLAYLPIPDEPNPFLGERGIRVGLNRPELLRTQLRAILRASTHGLVRVMFPMISTLPELRQVRQFVEEERQRLGVAPIQVGIMVEVPAVALMARRFAREADFFSIGANDLTQYTLAMDRGHPKLASKVDGLNPAVLRLISLAVVAAEREKRWVGVCGGIASDPQAVPLLVGMGVAELSVSVPTIPSIKAQIRSLNLERCRMLAEQSLDLETAAEVRGLCPDIADD